MMTYIGSRRHDAITKCIRQEGRFTAYDVGVSPVTLKALADRGLLIIVEERCTYPAKPYSYIVPNNVRIRFESPKT